MPKTQKELDDLWARTRAHNRARRRREWREAPLFAFLRLFRPVLWIIAIGAGLALYQIIMKTAQF